MERKAKAMGEAVATNDVYFEAVSRQEESVATDVVGIVLGLDRTSVPMEEDAPDKPLCKRRTPRQRKAPAPITVQWRMDYVGTVSFVDKGGESLYRRYFRAASKQSASDIAARMVSEVEHALTQNANLNVSIVQDGAPELWCALRRKLKALDVQWTETLDWYHASERLSTCLEICFADHNIREKRRKTWTNLLLSHDQGAQQVVHALKQRARKLPVTKAAALREHIQYFSQRLAQMRYASRKENGLPIGSGVTEGACKSIIAARAKRSGQRWRPAGLGAALTLRAFRQSQRFHAMWTAFKRLNQFFSCEDIH